MSDEAGADIDFGALQREIAEEVRARRASGDFPPSLERELDTLFSRYAPAAASEDFEAVLDEAARTAAIEASIPVESDKPGGRAAKQLIARGLGWYHSFLAAQLISFATSIVHAVQLLGRRVDSLEAVTGSSLRARDESERHAPQLADGVPAVVVAALAGVSGRMMVGESGDGSLLAALLAAGFDAYGVDPRRTLVDAAAARDLEVRAGDVRQHLVTVDDGALAAAVLTGFVERHPVGELVATLDLVADRLATDGVVVLASAAPIAHSLVSPVASDLSAGRPLHPRTWEHLLGEHGFATRSIPVGNLMPDAVEGADAAVAAIGELLGPLAYVVVARRAETG